MKHTAFLFLLFKCLFVFSQTTPEETALNKALAEENKAKHKIFLVSKVNDFKSDYEEATFIYALSKHHQWKLFENEERYKKHQKIFTEILALYGNDRNASLEDGILLNLVGEMLFANSKFTLAESAFKSAVRIIIQRGQGRSVSYAHVLNNLGMLYNVTSRFSLSESYFDKVLTLKKELFPLESSQIAASYSNNAVLYEDMGNYLGAEAMIEEAVRINEKALTKRSLAYAVSLNNKAMILFALRKYEEAEPLLIEAYKTSDEFLKDNSAYLTSIMENLAVLYQQMGKYSDAEVMFLKTWRMKESAFGVNHPDNSPIINLLAALYLRMPSKKSEIEGLLKKSVAINKKQFGDKHPSYANSASDLGNYYRSEGKFQEARPLLEKALEIRKRTLSSQHPDYISSLESMGLLLWQTKKIIEALPLIKKAAEVTQAEAYNYFSAMNEAEKQQFLNMVRLRFQRFNAYVIANYKVDASLINEMYDYSLLLKSLTLNATLKVRRKILASKDVAFVIKYKEWLDKKENLARAYQLSNEEQKEENLNLDSLQKVTNEIEKFLTSRSPLFAEGYIIQKTTVSQIAASLQPKEAAIEMIRVRKFDKILTDSVSYAALIITKEKSGAPILSVFDSGNEIEKAIYKKYKNSLRQKTDDTETYNTLWTKLGKLVADKSKFYISPDGIFQQINFNTLRTLQGTYLADEAEIVMITTTGDILKIKEKQIVPFQNKALLAGFPDYGSKGNIYKLPNTKNEVDTIQRILENYGCKVTILLQAKANEEEIKKVRSPGILHLATHAHFKDESKYKQQDIVFGEADDYSENDPLSKSGVLFAGAEKALTGAVENGVLTNDEITNLFLDTTDIAVLSACEPGISDVNNGEGLNGLKRSLIVAGSRFVMLSLWKVNDSITQELMNVFYPKYMLSLNAMEAYRATISEMRKKYTHPYYWGNFILSQ